MRIKETPIPDECLQAVHTEDDRVRFVGEVDVILGDVSRAKPQLQGHLSLVVHAVGHAHCTRVGQAEGHTGGAMICYLWVIHLHKTGMGMQM